MSNAIELDDPDPMIAFSNRMRNRRFHHFEQLTESMPRPLKIIDVGGTTDFWVRRGWGGRSDIQITTVNRDAESKRCQNIEPVVGDASNLSGFADQCFDIAFSNSVIEHLEIWENQAAMARGPARRPRLLRANPQLLVPDGAAFPDPGLAMDALVVARGDFAAAQVRILCQNSRPRPSAADNQGSTPALVPRTSSIVPGRLDICREIRRIRQVVDCLWWVWRYGV